MDANDLLTLGLGLTGSWRVVGQSLDLSKNPSELRLEVEAGRGERYPCPECGVPCKAHDFAEFSWRHLNFFQHHCLIMARVPRIRCPEHSLKRINVPWAAPSSGFTLLFEQAVILLTREMPVNAVARYVGVTDKRIWRVVQHYVTIFVDMDRNTRPVIFATLGKGKTCLEAFANFLKKQKGNPDNVIEVVCDMSPAFLAASEKTFKYAAVTVDWFHVVQIFTKALDEVWRLEARDAVLPKGTRWAVLKGQETCRTAEQIAALKELQTRGLATVTAFRVKELLRWVRQTDTRQAARWRATRFFAFAQELVSASNLLKPVRKALNTFREHLPHILRRWGSLLSNAPLEGLNGLFQAARSRARGYHNVDTFITVIYLIGAPIAELVMPK